MYKIYYKLQDNCTIPKNNKFQSSQARADDDCNRNDGTWKRAWKGED